jgi:hypothetical protein
VALLSFSAWAVAPPAQGLPTSHAGTGSHAITGAAREAAASPAPAVSPGAALSPGAELGAYEWDDSTWWPDPSSYAASLGRLKSLGVTTLYVDITAAVAMEDSHSASLASFLSDFEQLVRNAGADGVRIDAVGGDPHWATSDRQGPATLLAAVTQITTALGPGVLEGVQFDVEPWALAGWHNHKAGYARDWLLFMQSAVSAWTSDGLSGRLGFTVPYWFDGVTGGVPRVMFDGTAAYPFQLALAILAPLDDTVLNVMAYRNATAGPNGSLALMNGNVQAAVAARSTTALLAGQETGPASPAEVTFYGTSCATYQTAAGQIADAFDGDALYAGIAVDDVESFEALCPG